MVIRTAVTVLFIILCLVLIVVVLMQEGKSAGFGTFSGQVDSYVKKNRAHTKEGKLERITVILAVLFFVIAIGLSLKFFQ
ncbi:MAG: preprotein translocase subunit SecG [Eubacterium sp.]|nr:preprotein translocase subunit SecG [Eubacterium sp.]